VTEFNYVHGLQYATIVCWVCPSPYHECAMDPAHLRCCFIRRNSSGVVGPCGEARSRWRRAGCRNSEAWISINSRRLYGVDHLQLRHSRRVKRQQEHCRAEYNHLSAEFNQTAESKIHLYICNIDW